MSSARHRERLSTFAEVSDPSLEGLQTKIANFQKKQKNQTKINEDSFGWIHAQRNLKDAEAALSRQIRQSSLNVLEYMQKEKDYERLYELCGINPISRANAVKSMQDDMAVLRKPADVISYHGKDVSAFISHVRKCEMKEGYHAIGAKSKMLLDLGENVLTSLEAVDERYSNLVSDTRGHRKTVITLLSDEQVHGTQHRLPQDLSKALESLRVMVRENRFIEDGGEIDLLTISFRRNLEDIYNVQKTKGSPHEFKKMIQDIEKKGLKEVERLRTKFNERSNRMRAKMENDLKRKEVRLRLQATRLEREGCRFTEVETLRRAAVKKVGDDCKKEVRRTKRMLETTQQIINHQTQQLQDSENSRVRNQQMHEDFNEEIKSLRHKSANKARTHFRQERINDKIMEQKKALDAAFKTEEFRLGRLNALAASVPYYNSIMDKSADIHRSTEARKNDVYEGCSNLADFQCGKLKSFTNEKIFSDINFRIGHALHEAGLAHSTHARDAIRNAIPRTEARTTGIKPY